MKRYTVVFEGKIATAEIRRVKEHWEIFLNGKFVASADWLHEAEEKLNKICE